jgi:hypothetical protein
LIADTVVTVSEDDCAIMMKNSALEAISKTVLVKKREANNNESNVPKQEASEIWLSSL